MYRRSRRMTFRRRNARSIGLKPRRNAVASYARSIMPSMFYRRFRYVDAADFSAVDDGVVAWLVYRVNGVYDPYAGTGGHQPYGLDQLAPFYSRYTCYGSKLRVVFSNYGTDPYTAIIAVSYESSISTTAASVQEVYPHVTTPVFTGEAASLQSRVSVKKYFSVASIFDQTEEFSVAVPFVGNPAAQIFYHIGVYTNQTGGTDLNHASCNIYLDYYGAFDQPRPLDLS